MASVNHRAKLLSDLMAVRNAAAAAAASSDAAERAGAETISAMKSAEGGGESLSTTKTDDTGAADVAATPSEMPPLPRGLATPTVQLAPSKTIPPTSANMLFAKGNASASNFRPDNWTYDRPKDYDRPWTYDRSAIVAAAQSADQNRRRRIPRVVLYVVPVVLGLALVIGAGLLILSQGHRETGLSSLQPQTIQLDPALKPSSPPTATPLTSSAQAGEVVRPTRPAPTQASKESSIPPTPPMPAPVIVAAAPQAAIVEPPPPPPPPPVRTIADSGFVLPPPIELAPIPPPAPVAAAPTPTPAPAVSAPAAAIASLAPAAVAKPEPAPVAVAKAEPAPAADDDIGPLLARGSALLQAGDVSGARLFFQRAAEQGSAIGATAVGQTFDPLILEQLRVRGVRGDAKAAAEWYRKAIARGDPQAEMRLSRLLAKQPE